MCSFPDISCRKLLLNRSCTQRIQHHAICFVFCQVVELSLFGAHFRFQFPVRSFPFVHGAKMDAPSTILLCVPPSTMHYIQLLIAAVRGTYKQCCRYHSYHSCHTLSATPSDGASLRFTPLYHTRRVLLLFVAAAEVTTQRACLPSVCGVPYPFQFPYDRKYSPHLNIWCQYRTVTIFLVTVVVPGTSTSYSVHIHAILQDRSPV